jgi:ADP-ribose pyrophosphatase YjhB (NUDIX family)
MARVAIDFVEQAARPTGGVALALFPGSDEHGGHAEQMREDGLAGFDCFARAADGDRIVLGSGKRTGCDYGFGPQAAPAAITGKRLCYKRGNYDEGLHRRRFGYSVSMIRLISICLFRNRDRILVAESADSVKGDRYARPLGGGIEVGETSAQAIVREIREEIGQEISDLRLLGVLENIFTCEGRRGHEIVFVYDAVFVDRAMYDREEIPVAEGGWTTPAAWRSMDSFGDGCRLVPEGLAALLAGRK